MHVDPTQKKQLVRKVAHRSVGEDSSAIMDGQAGELVEQAQEIQATRPATPADRYDAAISAAVSARHEQCEQIEARLEQLVGRQTAQLQNTQALKPGRVSLPSTRARWLMQQQQQMAGLQRLQGRLQVVREIKDGIGAGGVSVIEELARDKLKRENPELVAQRDAQRKRESEERVQAVQREREQQAVQVKEVLAGRKPPTLALQRQISR